MGGLYLMAREPLTRQADYRKALFLLSMNRPVQEPYKRDWSGRQTSLDNRGIPRFKRAFHPPWWHMACSFSPGFHKSLRDLQMDR